MNRFLFAWVLLLWISPVMVAQSELDGIDPSGQVIVYWHEWDGPQLDAMRAVVGKFNRENPHQIVVQLVGKSSSGRLLGELASDPDPAEARPNVVGGIFPSHVSDLLAEGLVIPLDVYVTHPTWGVTPEDAAGIGVGVRGTFSSALGQGAWPLGLSLNVLAFNQQMLVTLGAQSIPSTLDDLTQWACAAAHSTTPRGQAIQGFPLSLTLGDFEGLVAAQGGALYDATVANFLFNSPQSQTVLAWLQNLNAQGCAYDPGGAYNDSRDFAYGLTPFAFTSSAGLPFIESDIMDSASGLTDWAFMPIPGSQFAAQIYLRGVGIAPSESPQARLASWLFIRYLTTPEAQTLWARGLSYQPVNRNAYELLGEDFLTVNPAYRSVLEMLRRTDVSTFITPPMIGYGDVENQVYEPMIEAVLAGADIPTVTTEAERAAAQVIIEAVREANQK